MARTLFSDDPEPFDNNVIPWAVYTYPTLAHVGQTEEELKVAGREYRIAQASLEKKPRAIAEGETDGIFKLLIDSDGKILGGHILAPHAGDLLGPVVVAMKHSLSINDLANTLFPYPTLVETVQSVAGAIK